MLVPYCIMHNYAAYTLHLIVTMYRVITERIISLFQTTSEYTRAKANCQNNFSPSVSLPLSVTRVCFSWTFNLLKICFKLLCSWPKFVTFILSCKQFTTLISFSHDLVINNSTNNFFFVQVSVYLSTLKFFHREDASLCFKPLLF